MLIDFFLERKMLIVTRCGLYEMLE